MTTTTIESPLARLTDEQIEELGREFDAIHDEVYDDLGDRDRRYIVSMIELHRRLAGRDGAHVHQRARGPGGDRAMTRTGDT